MPTVSGAVEWVILAAALITAIGVVWQRFLRPAFTRLGAVQRLIEQELSTNGGASLKDQVTTAAAHAENAASKAQIAADLAAELDALLQQRQTSLEESQTRLTERVEAIAERLALMQLTAKQEAILARAELSERHDRHDEDLGEVKSRIRRDEYPT